MMLDKGQKVIAMLAMPSRRHPMYERAASRTAGTLIRRWSTSGRQA